MHEGDYSVEATGGRAPLGLRRPDGRILLSAPPDLPATDHVAIKRQHRVAGLDIDPGTAIPGWYGERLDLGLALDALFSRERRGAASPKE